MLLHLQSKHVGVIATMHSLKFLQPTLKYQLCKVVPQFASQAPAMRCDRQCWNGSGLPFRIKSQALPDLVRRIADHFVLVRGTLHHCLVEVGVLRNCYHTKGIQGGKPDARVWVCGGQLAQDPLGISVAMG